jgi:small neutral amino acid transporter SnatA (MarC family)
VNDFGVALLGLFAAISPAGAAPVFLSLHPVIRERAAAAALAALVAFLALAFVTVAGEPFIDWLDISPESFQLAAAAIMAPHAMHLLWSGISLTLRGPGAYGPLPAWIIPLGLPLLAGPAAMAASLSYGTRFGTEVALGASALILVLAVAWVAGEGRLERLYGRSGAGVLGRLTGILLIIIAVEMALDGIRSV